MATTITATIKKTEGGIEYLFGLLKEKAKTVTRAAFWKIPHKTPQEDICLKIGRYNKNGFAPDTLEVENPKSELTLDNEEVQIKIEKLFGDNFSIENFEEEIKALHKEAEALKNEIIIAFSAFPFDTNTEKEKGLFAQIENYEFGKPKGEFISDRLPKTMMSRDTEALRQGTCIASWLYYEGVALEGKSLSEATNNFLGLVDRLVRQLEMKKNKYSRNSFNII